MHMLVCSGKQSFLESWRSRPRYTLQYSKPAVTHGQAYKMCLMRVEHHEITCMWTLQEIAVASYPFSPWKTRNIQLVPPVYERLTHLCCCFQLWILNHANPEKSVNGGMIRCSALEHATATAAQLVLVCRNKDHFQRQPWLGLWRFYV